VDFAFSEEQEMLRRSTRDFLAKECGSKVVRKLMEGPDAYDPTLWKKIAALGWTSLGIPEQYGGAGSFLDLIVVLEECGRALLPGPFFATMGLAVPALIEAGTEPQKKEALGAIANAATRASDLRLIDLEDIGRHYARTLADWRRRFEDRWSHARALGFDDDFLRMWRFYFAYCEAGFLERRASGVQVVLARSGWRGDSGLRGA